MKGQDEGTPGGSGPDGFRHYAFVMRALGRTPVSLGYQNRDLVYEWVENPPRGLSVADVLGRSDADFLPGQTAERLEAAKREVIETGEAQRFELPMTVGGELRWFDIWLDPDPGTDEAVAGVFSTVIDIGDRKRRETQLKNLLREVSHRSRNLLAIVLSLASQTARSATSLPGFVTAFSGRLQAIARAQDLVTDRDWQGALLSDLVAREVALFHRDNVLPVTMTGDDLVISPSAALYVGLAIHELAAHAVKNGQLSGNGGTILVVIDRHAEGRQEGGIAITWTERFGPGLSGQEIEPLTRKFLESVVPLAVDGTSTLGESGNGIEYVLRIDERHIT